MSQTHTNYLSSIAHCLYSHPYVSSELHTLSNRHFSQQSRKQLLHTISQAFPDQATFNTITPHQKTNLLGIAVQYQHRGFVLWLLKHGVRPNAIQGQHSALHYAIENNDVRMCITLKRYGAKLNTFDVQQTGYQRFHANFDYS